MCSGELGCYAFVIDRILYEYEYRPRALHDGGYTRTALVLHVTHVSPAEEC
jgi:hypothetical protein